MSLLGGSWSAEGHTDELRAEAQRIAIELDPDWAERRYREAVRQRRVVRYLNDDGTVTIAAEDQDAAEALAAYARLTGLARAAKNTGAHAPLDALRSDISMGLQGHCFTGLHENDIIHYLVAKYPKPVPDEPADDTAVDQPAQATDADPVDAEPTTAEPTGDVPPFEEPPTDEEPSRGASTHEEPVHQPPVEEHPVNEHPVNDEIPRGGVLRGRAAGPGTARSRVLRRRTVHRQAAQRTGHRRSRAVPPLLPATAHRPDHDPDPPPF